MTIIIMLVSSGVEHLFLDTSYTKRFESLYLIQSGTYNDVAMIIIGQSLKETFTNIEKKAGQ